MKRIAIIYERPLDTGGVETHLLSLFRNIDREQYQFIVFSPASIKFQEQSKSLGVEFQLLPRFTPLSLSTFYNLSILFRQWKIDLVHIHSPIAAIPGRLATRLCGLPCLVTIHLPAEDYYGELTTFRARSGRLLFSSIDRVFNFLLSDKLIYVSYHKYQEAISQHRTPEKRSMVIPNGVDLSKFYDNSDVNDFRKQNTVPEDGLVLTFVGRLDEQKGVDILIQALAALDKNVLTKLQVWIIGSGPQEVKLLSQCQEQKLTGMVRFFGQQDNITGFLQASDMFVLPSRYEGMPIALLEALAAGVPSIVTDVGDNASVVSHLVQGWVVPPNDPKALAEAIQALTSDRELRKQMGDEAKKRALDFDERTTTRKIIDLYREYTS